MPSPVVYLDLETRQGKHSLGLGEHIYASDCSLILGYYAVEDGEPVRFDTDRELADALWGLVGCQDLFWLVVQNAMFESSVIAAQMPLTQEIVGRQGLWRDTMVAARSVNLPGSLDRMHAVLFPDMQGKLLEGSVQARGGADLLSDPEELAAYCAQDVEMMRRAWKAIGPLMTPIDLALTPVDLKINRRGFPVDTRECVVKQAQVKARRDELEAWVRKQGYAYALQGSGGYLLGSKQKVKALLGDLSSDPGARHEDLLAAAKEDWQLQAAEDKWAKGREFTAADGRAHGFLNVRAALTGRWTSSDIQVQNMKRSEDDIPPLLDTRRMIRAGEGNVLVAADYSQMELRLGLWMVQATEHLQALADGRDLYAELAEQAVGHPPSRHERWVMKSAMLGLTYGAGKAKTFETLAKAGTPTELAEAVWDTLNRTLRPKFRAAWDRLWVKLKENHGTYWGEEDVWKGCTWLRLPLYRRIMLWHDVRWGKEDGGTEERTTHLERLGAMGRREPLWGGTAFAHVVQGTASDVVAGALVLAEAGLEDHPAKVALHVHDEIVLECPKDRADEAAGLLKGWMVQAGKGQPVAVSVGIGKTLAECK